MSILMIDVPLHQANGILALAVMSRQGQPGSNPVVPHLVRDSHLVTDVCRHCYQYQEFQVLSKLLLLISMKKDALMGLMTMTIWSLFCGRASSWEQH
jgi:hypothetical protein